MHATLVITWSCSFFQRSKMLVSFKCPMKFGKFPVDRQNCKPPFSLVLQTFPYVIVSCQLQGNLTFTTESYSTDELDLLPGVTWLPNTVTPDLLDLNTYLTYGVWGPFYVSRITNTTEYMLSNEFGDYKYIGLVFLRLYYFNFLLVFAGIWPE